MDAPATGEARGEEQQPYDTRPTAEDEHAARSGRPEAELTPVATGVQMKRRGPWVSWALGLVTFGIYYLYWWYKIHEEMSYFDPRQRIDPLMSLMAVFVGPVILVPPLVSNFAQGDRIARAQRAAGLSPTCLGALGLLLYLCMGLVVVYYQSELNRIIDRYDVPEGAQVPLYT
ncbi:MAG: DUF4234 domain-containing protein [Actinocatenispora sp.]